ncbi:MAG TPA: hypothetical protein VH583_04130 [Vicinamibacterales bacterium]
MIIPFGRERARASAAIVGAIAVIVGVIAAVHYHRLGLTLSHYDARGHLIVARRIFDSITPGWQQIGAVWLPLPHLLNAIPVQSDFLYRTGASAVALSIVSFAVATAGIAWIVTAITGSAWAAAAAATVFALNPNVLYLQSTPMTEPLLLALVVLGIALLVADHHAAAGIVLALACLTRYEAWPVTVAALVFAIWVRWRDGCTLRDAVRPVRDAAVYPVVAIVGFSIFSRVVVGSWFVGSGFFVPENKSLGDAWLTIKEIAWGTQMLSHEALVWLGAAGLAAAVVIAVWRRRDAIFVTALLAMSATPLVAFYRGHPFRIRYMVPLIAVEAIGAGIAAGALQKIARPASVAVAAIALFTLRPLDGSAPMVVEAQWDRPNVAVRARVTECLGRPRPGEKIMASMGSLGHYMQEASRAGFDLRDFLHEGNGDIWLAALNEPRPFADWLLIEEKAEGGDMLAQIARERPAFLAGYSRVCEGAGLALYRRN